MITIRFYQKPGCGSIHMTVRGHAGAGPRGQDLVCCAVTTLCYTIAQTVQFMFGEGQLSKKPRLCLREGEGTVIATPRPEYYDRCLHAFWVTQCGCHMLAKSYPEYVKLEHF